MSFAQKTITLPARSAGCYLITDHIEHALADGGGGGRGKEEDMLRPFRIGILHLFIQHTSCALSLNENWDDDVRADMADALARVVPEDKNDHRQQGLYRHSAEGSDDMPAHVKSALVGASVSIPIKDGRLALGTWQGIWYLEFRRAKHTRRVVATVQGERR